MDAREIGLTTRPRKAGRHFALLTLGALGNDV
jgi:hypothetical protein